MHEMSIAANIIRIAEAELLKAHGKSVEKVFLKIGQLSGIEVESLLFALQVSEGVLKDAEISIEELPGRLRCVHCGKIFESGDLYTICPGCHQYKVEVLSGKDLLVKSITIR